MSPTDIDYSKSTLVLRAASRLAAAAHIKENSTLSFDQALTTLNACALDMALEEIRDELSKISSQVDNTDALEALRKTIYLTGDDITVQLRAVAQRD